MDDKKTYKMLKTVSGSLDGVTVLNFAQGEIRHDITPELAEQFYHQGAVEEVDANAEAEDSEPNLREGARSRVTKVTGPTENKVTGPAETKQGEAGVDLDTQNVEELAAVARDNYGLDVDTTMDEATLREMIRNAQGAESGAEVATNESVPGKKAKKGK